MDKDIQIELMKFITSLPTTALLVLFIVAIYRDFRTLVSSLLTFFNREFSAWLALFRSVFAKSYDDEPGSKPGE